MPTQNKIRLVLIDANGQAHVVSENVLEYFGHKRFDVITHGDGSKKVYVSTIDSRKYEDGYGVIDEMGENVENTLISILVEGEGK